MKVIALALRRSGSTAFWKIFDGNNRYLALDEPCNPKLSMLPHMHHKHTWDKFIELYYSSPELFREHFSPISKEEELDETLSKATTEYFRFLLRGRKDWFMDLTRCHLKIFRLTEEFPDARVIHLFRKPIGFVSSHMIPTYGKWRAKRDRFLNKYIFWQRSGGYNTWSLETIYENWFQRLADKFDALGLPQEALKVKKTHEKLLLYWLFHYRFMELYGKEAFGGRFSSICFDEFCAEPERHMEAFLQGSSENINDFDLSHLKPVKPGYKFGNKRWQTSMAKVGFTEQEIVHWTAS